MTKRKNNPNKYGIVTKRSYFEEIPDYADLMTVEQWKNGQFIQYDGSGYWTKDNKMSNDSVFRTSQEDATHVAWFNK